MSESAGSPWRFVFNLNDKRLNLPNKSRQIGMNEAHLRRRNSIMLDIRRHMLVMRTRAPQSEIIGMRLRVVPV
jgi:hypothetical protein